MTPFLLASRSEHKAREVRRILGGAGIRIHTLEEAGVATAPEEDDIEVFESFRENALAKARYFAALTDLPVVADDSGIQVDALGGAPGVRSRRFSAATVTGDALDRANNAALLDRLRGVPTERRLARYVCAAVALRPGTAPIVTLGSVSGIILEQPEGTGGFGYDPLFLPNGENVSFGQMPPGRKDRISHRALAFLALAACLPTYR